ncbi:hypothetical protein BC938DRAFT_472074 [Jimgerdemannia flammicorona]|uniref:WD40-repeat-containing domain protein n=1 Tax=Jimgerdemannia flammicorona TaxID=994334 RepID=A0A433QU79_9FUNG|nr:hypothetical protein BC938DRAFT_472074 [Jimgerdemannia flammicorona]
MKFGRKRGATTVTPAPASDKLAPNTDEAEAAEEMRDSDELNGTVASASTLSASTASSGTVGGSPHTARYVKVKTKHKSAKSFPRLLLAQTLDTAALSAASGTSFSATSQSTASAPISTSPILSPATASTPQTTLAGSDAADPSLPLQGAIWTIKFSRDGKYLASGGQDFVVRVWAVFGTDVTPVAEKKDAGTGLASSGPEATTPDEMERDAKVFRDKPVHEYRGHTADVLDLSWSKNNFLLSSSMDKTVRLWHVSRKECLCVFPHLDFVTAIAFHPRDDRFFLSGSLDCKLRLWNIPEKKVAFWNEVPDDNLITAVGFTLDGKIACAGSYVGLCLFYETDGLRYNTQISVKDQKGRNSKKGRKITGIEPVPNMPPGEEKLLITSNDSRIRLVNMRDKSWECKYKGLENTSSQIKATFSDDGKYIICGSEDHSVYIWNTEQPGFVLPFHNDAHPQPTQTASAGLLTKSLGTALGALGEQALHAAVTPAGVPGNTTSRVGGWFKKREATIAVPAPIREKLKGSFESFEGYNHDCEYVFVVLMPL